MDGSDRMPQRPIPMPAPQQQDINTMQVPVSMPVAAWQQILDMLGQQRWCDVNPIMMNIHRQVQMGVQQQQQMGMGVGTQP